MNLKITFNGTGTSQGVPVISCTCLVCNSKDPRDRRLRTSILIEDHQTSVCIDAGPDFRQQMLKVHQKRLDAIVLTHEHKDHLAGLDDVRAFNYTMGQSMPVFAHQRVIEALRREFSYVFENPNYPGLPQFELMPINNRPFKIGSLDLLPIPVLHADLPVMGFRINDFVYITDANCIPESTWPLLNKVRVLVINALRIQPHYSHYTLAEALEIIRRIQPQRAYITHISHQMGLHETVSQQLPDYVELASDGLQLML
jgi:phosphoribosyl 1,2-cyclic phosphate phosphodiesterase